VWLDKDFRWVPSWVYILILVSLPIFLIVLFCVMQRRRVTVPLCQEHRRHWSGRTRLVLGSLLALAVVVAVVMCTELLLPNASGEMIEAGAIVGLLGFFAWLVLAAIVQSGTIRALEFTPTEIKLCGVSRDFVDAYEDDLDERERRIARRARERWDERRARPRDPDERVRQEERRERDEGRDRYREE
jgi:hypothetical protein